MITGDYDANKVLEELYSMEIHDFESIMLDGVFVLEELYSMEIYK